MQAKLTPPTVLRHRTPRGAVNQNAYHQIQGLYVLIENDSLRLLTITDTEVCI
jgi:hypothetical protein